MPFPRATSVPLPVPGPAAPLPHAASSARGAASAGATRRLDAIVDVFFRQGGQLGTRIQRRQLLEAADRPAVDEDLRHGAAARAAHEIGACLGVAAHVDLVEGHAARPQQPLRAHAERAARRGIYLDARHRVEARPRAPASQALTARRPADTVARWPIRASPRRSRAWWT